MRWFRYILLITIIGTWGFVFYSYESLPDYRVEGRPGGSLGVAYEECAQTHGLPMRGMRTVPIAELGINDRNILLGCAAQSGNLEFLRWTLKGAKERLSIDRRFEGGWPLAAVAAWADGKMAVEALKLFLEENDVLWKSNSSAPLSAAIYETATVDTAKYLAKKFPDLLKEDNRALFSPEDYPKYFGLTVAQYHAFKGRIAVAEYFAGKGSRIATRDLHFRHWLLEKDKNKLLDDKLDVFLAAHGVLVDERDDKGSTVLCAAVALGDERLVSRYLARGANANAADNAGETPLHDAARKNRRALVTLLLGYANPNLRNHKGQTPLHVAFSTAAWQASEALLDKGVRLDIRDTLGRTPLFECVSQGCPLLDRLAASGVDFDIHDNARNSLLHEAAAFNGAASGMAQMLIARGTPVDSKNIEGKTAMHLAAERNDPALVSLLLAKGALPNERDNLGNTPLHRASSAETVIPLLAAGANPDLANKRGDRPVNGTVERTRMLFYSPAQIRTKADTLPRYFSSIRVLGDTDSSIVLTSPATGTLGAVVLGADNTMTTGEVEFILRGADLEFRVQQSCEAGAYMKWGEEEESLILRHLPVHSSWQDVIPLEGKPRSFRSTIKSDGCGLPVITPEILLAAIKRQQPADVVKWQAVAKGCTATGGNSEHCSIFVRPVLRVLVKRGNEWKEAGILHTVEAEE